MSKPAIQFDTYASHLPILAWACSLPETKLRRCLEIGTGFYSTALIQSVGGHSVETEEDYYKEIIKVYPKIKLMKNYERLVNYSFIFIDSTPEESRVEHVKSFRYNTDLFILHDAVAEWDYKYKYKSIIPQFNFHKIVGLRPHTLLLSDRPISYEGL